MTNQEQLSIKQSGHEDQAEAIEADEPGSIDRKPKEGLGDAEPTRREREKRYRRRQLATMGTLALAAFLVAPKAESGSTSRKIIGHTERILKDETSANEKMDKLRGEIEVRMQIIDDLIRSLWVINKDLVLNDEQAIDDTLNFEIDFISEKYSYIILLEDNAQKQAELEKEKTAKIVEAVARSLRLKEQLKEKQSHVGTDATEKRAKETRKEWRTTHRKLEREKREYDKDRYELLEKASDRSARLKRDIWQGVIGVSADVVEDILTESPSEKREKAREQSRQKGEYNKRKREAATEKKKQE